MLSEHKTVVSESLEDKKLRLERILRELGQAAVAFSGGVDSALLLKAAVRGLGPSAVLAVTVSSPVHPAWERAEAEWLAGDLGVRHIVIESDELEDESFVSNSPDRCYVCKFARFRELKRIAREHGFAHVVDGSNVDDLHDFRPGQRAAAEHEVRSPLREAGFTKADIRTYSRELDLHTWDRPSQACLASRFPYGERITAQGLTQVGQAEDFLRSVVSGAVRVRHHGNLARVEVEPAQLGALLARKDDVATHLHALGFTYVTLDLVGFRSGSMNEVLS